MYIMEHAGHMSSCTSTATFSPAMTVTATAMALLHTGFHGHANAVRGEHM